MKEILDLAAILPWIGAIMAIAGFVALLKQIFGAGEKVNSDKIAKVEKVMQEQIEAHETTLINHDRRIQKVESDINHLPDRDSTHRLELTMEKISSRLDILDERMRPIANTTVRLQAYLLEKGQK